MFMSRNALKGIEPQTCLDDLESFYYVLLYLARKHMGSKFSRDLPTPLDGWNRPLASSMKHGFLFHEFEFPTDPLLGKPFRTLVERLHSVFRNILVQDFLAKFSHEPPPIVHHEEIYDKMLSHVRDAIDDLDREIRDGITTPPAPTHDEAGVDSFFAESSGSVKRWSKIQARKKIVRTLAANRARRKKASPRLTDRVRT